VFFASLPLHANRRHLLSLTARFDACEVCGGTNDTCALILIIMDAAPGLEISMPLLAFAALWLIQMLAA
jgi:hypothetical protein